jgi:hypothetical protein
MTWRVISSRPYAKGIWEQRTSWLHQELLALTTERLRPQAPGEEVSWDRIVRLVYTCADSVRAAEAGKDAAEANLVREGVKVAEAEVRVAAGAYTRPLCSST